jgi:hypothetical protein
MSCKILSPAEFEVSRAERLVWTCSVHLVAKFHDLRTIGAVLEDKYWKETEACMRELASAVHSTSVLAHAFGDGAWDFGLGFRDFGFRVSGFGSRGWLHAGGLLFGALHLQRIARVAKP